MKNIHSHPTPLRQKFIEYLTLQGKAPRTVQCYTSFIYDLARFHHAPPDTLTEAQLQQWFYHLIAERQFSASSVNLAINAVRSFHGGLLQQPVEPLLRSIKRPARKRIMPRPLSLEQVEALLTRGVEGDLRSRAFLMAVYGCGLRLSEATHIRVPDLRSQRGQLLVAHAKGGHQRYTLLSDSLLEALRDYWRAYEPEGPWLFPGEEPTLPMCKGTGQNLYYRAVRRAGIIGVGGIHSLRHSFATHLLESGVEITVVQRLLGHTSLGTTALYLHVRRERLAQVQSPLGLLDLSSPLLRR